MFVIPRRGCRTIAAFTLVLKFKKNSFRFWVFKFFYFFLTTTRSSPNTCLCLVKQKHDRLPGVVCCLSCITLRWKEILQICLLIFSDHLRPWSRRSKGQEKEPVWPLRLLSYDQSSEIIYYRSETNHHWYYIIDHRPKIIDYSSFRRSLLFLN